MGDPAGIGPEVLLNSLIRFPSHVEPMVVGDRSFLESLARRLRIRFPEKRICWVDHPMSERIRPGKVQAAGGRAAYACLEEAVRLLRLGRAEALVTAPVSKEAIVRGGIRWRGHTEYLAARFGCRTTMLLVTGRFRAALATTHASMGELPKYLKTPDLVRTIRQTRDSLRRDFGIARPRIGLAALNPHGGEGGLFGGEEKTVLRPAALKVGGGVEGPIPSDTLMKWAAEGRYDAVVAVYHDQALIPVKLLGWQQAVNVTLGLPFVRTSPVHGTAFDLAGKGKANPSSMRSAIHLAVDLARRRVRRPGR